MIMREELSLILDRPCGWSLFVAVVPCSTQDGTGHGTIRVEVLPLGNGVAAYRSSSDEIAGRWQIGDADAIMAMVESLGEDHTQEA